MGLALVLALVGCESEGRGSLVLGALEENVPWGVVGASAACDVVNIVAVGHPSWGGVAVTVGTSAVASAVVGGGVVVPPHWQPQPATSSDSASASQYSSPIIVLFLPAPLVDQLCPTME